MPLLCSSVISGPRVHLGVRNRGSNRSTWSCFRALYQSPIRSNQVSSSFMQHYPIVYKVIISSSNVMLYFTALLSDTISVYWIVWFIFNEFAEAVESDRLPDINSLVYGCWGWSRDHFGGSTAGDHAGARCCLAAVVITVARSWWCKNRRALSSFFALRLSTPSRIKNIQHGGGLVGKNDLSASRCSCWVNPLSLASFWAREGASQCFNG